MIWTTEANQASAHAFEVFELPYFSFASITLLFVSFVGFFFVLGPDQAEHEQKPQYC